jgi:hypothetical protein
MIDRRFVMRDIQLVRKAQKFAHPILLLVQELLRKTSVIGQVKVGGERVEWSGLGGRDSISLDLLLNFFFPPSEEKILKRNSARKKGRGPGSTSPLYQLQTSRWMNFFKVNRKQPPYSDAHVRALAT